MNEIRDAIEHYRAHPWEFASDVIACASLTLLTVGMLYLPLILGE